jgi:hypothetical protein
MEISARTYETQRVNDTLWKVCEGKQVLNHVARSTGYSGAPALILATFAAWERQDDLLPEELTAFRNYLARL